MNKHIIEKQSNEIFSLKGTTVIDPKKITDNIDNKVSEVKQEFEKRLQVFIKEYMEYWKRMHIWIHDRGRRGGDAVCVAGGVPAHLHAG